MTLYYIYDGSFEGLLTSIFEAFYNKDKPNFIVSALPLQKGMFDSFVQIDTDPEKSKRVSDSINRNISWNTLEDIYYTFLSDYENREMWILEYLKLAFKLGSKTGCSLADDRVWKIKTTRQKVEWEVHRMVGLIRFMKLDNNVFYAAMEPDHNISVLLAPHFADRFPDQYWIIHDLKRGLSVLYNMKEWIISDAIHFGNIELADTDSIYQKLWKQYFDNIAIESRINPKLQRQFMPVRYWQHLVEKQADIRL